MQLSMGTSLENLGAFKDFSDGSIKTVFRTQDREIIESTLLFNKPCYDVLCVPTHHFCSLGCKMCHLTNTSLNKSMVPIKVENLIEAVVKSVCFNLDESLSCDSSINAHSITRRTHKNRLLISYMGVGEPFLNLNLIKQLYLQEEYLKGLLHYTEINYALSTMMPNDNVVELIKLVNEYEIPLKLHFSLPSPFDEERFELIPSAKTTIDEAFTYLLQYKSSVKSNLHIMEKYRLFHNIDDPIEINYTLIKGVNDSKDHLDKMIELLKKYLIPIKFIRFNPINNMEISDNENLWVKTITEQLPQLRVKTYSPPGREIGSLCGEFTKHYYHEEIESQEQLAEFREWETKHRIYENNRKDYISWDEYYMGVALLAAKRSKDPSTQVGACIVGNDNRILSSGYNGTPNAVDDDRFNWSREGGLLNSKYAYVIHAEVNAILNYRGNMRDLNDATLYVTLFPCHECAKFIVQSGIRKIIYLSDKYYDKEETLASKRILTNCGVRFMPYQGNSTHITLEFIK